MYFCALPAILGAEIDVVSVRIGDAVNDQYHSGSEAGSPVSDGYGTCNGCQRADFWVTRTVRNLSGPGPWHNQSEQVHEATSCLDASSHQDAARRRGRGDHLCCIVHDQPGAHPARHPRIIEWDEYRRMAPGEHDDDYAGANAGAFCWHCLPVVHR